ncbi:uncharacterized protein LOC136088775 isoform X3 [Hydra vulgaris]|uniref:Uncharacterized protein LOC136088775 isoform X3 n=1 Tax=Hydra vulgaris TaxID=6087 RepID=A0ABM4D5E9_HYDVU
MQQSISINASTDEDQPKRKKFRCRQLGESNYLWPDICIICQKKQKWNNNKITVSIQPLSIQEPLSSISPYQIGKKESPKLKKLIEKINIDLVISSISIEKVKDQDRAYLLCKSQIQENSFPSWTAFNISQNKAASHVSYIGYLPVVNAPVTDIATIYTILRRSVDIINKLNLKYGVIGCDEAVYSKIQMVRWKEPEFSNRFVVRLVGERISYYDVIYDCYC